MSSSSSAKDSVNGTLLYTELVTALKQQEPQQQGVRPGPPVSIRMQQAGAGAANEETLLYSFPSTGGATPVARWAHAAAAVGSLLFAYGGVGQVVLDDLAVLDTDLMTWRALKPRAAAPRDRPGKLHAAAMAAAGRCLWLFGGQQGRKFLRELYCLDTDSMAWSLAAPAGPSPPARAGHTLTAVDGAGIFLFGGQGKKLFDDLHVLLPHGQHAQHDAASACSASSASSSGAARRPRGAAAYRRPPCRLP